MADLSFDPAGQVEPGGEASSLGAGSKFGVHGEAELDADRLALGEVAGHGQTVVG
jgi:hypothetical protein